MRWSQYSPVQIVRFLRLIIAIFGNNTLYLDPYVSLIERDFVHNLWKYEMYGKLLKQSPVGSNV